jgi:hypothetical protein
MFKLTSAIMAFFFSTGFVVAAKADGFSCEQIKEKAVRASCIKSRDAENSKKAEKVERVIKADDEKFIERAKQELTRNFKDPESAQYRNLFLVTHDGGNAKTLCGEVNAKNSYGGYVGGKLFYVRWTQAYEDDNLGMMTWINDGSESGPLAQSGLDMMKMYCFHKGDDVKVTQISSK